jgi:hypothetical protein
MSYAFSSGSLFAKKSDTLNSVVKFADLQDVSIDFDFDIKELTGKKLYPIAVGRSGGKVGGKASFANIRPEAFELLLGGTKTTGQKLFAEHTAAVPETPFAITVTNSATFAEDYGVEKIVNGVAIPLTKVASSPATGQYSVSSGVYTFAAADTGITMLISYMYSSSTGGNIITLGNDDAGSITSFSMFLSEEFESKQINAYFNKAVSSKMGLASKLGDFTIPSIDLSMYADATGLGWLSISD